MMRRVVIELSEHNGATSIQLRISPPRTTATNVPGTYSFEVLIPGHVISTNEEATEETAVVLVRAITAELMRELSCSHGDDPWCTLSATGFLAGDPTEVIAPS